MKKSTTVVIKKSFCTVLKVQSAPQSRLPYFHRTFIEFLLSTSKPLSIWRI